jgi:hypothetical protein
MISPCRRLTFGAHERFSHPSHYKTFANIRQVLIKIDKTLTNSELADILRPSFDAP